MRQIRICPPYILLLILFLIAACESPIDKLIPEAAVQDGVPHVQYDIERQDRKAVKGGYLVESQGAVPYDVTRPQVRATILGAIKGIKHRYSDCEWIIVFLCPEDCGPGLYAGKGEYREGTIEISYAIPTDRDMEEWNAKIGTPQPGLFSGSFISDGPRLYRPDKETALLCLDLKKRFRDIHRRYVEAALAKTGRAEFLDSDKIYREISKKTNLPFSRVKTTSAYCNTYYGAVGQWGDERLPKE